MPSTKGGDRARPEGAQLRLPTAPRLDRTGLHDRDCECGRCALGFRPSNKERDRARWAYERAIERQKVEAAAAAKAEKEGVKSAVRVEGLRKAEREAAEMIRRIQAPVVRPATREELDELRREHGFRVKRRDRP